MITENIVIEMKFQNIGDWDVIGHYSSVEQARSRIQMFIDSHKEDAYPKVFRISRTTHEVVEEFAGND